MRHDYTSWAGHCSSPEICGRIIPSTENEDHIQRDESEHQDVHVPHIPLSSYGHVISMAGLYCQGDGANTYNNSTPRLNNGMDGSSIANKCGDRSIGRQHPDKQTEDFPVDCCFYL